MKTVVIVNDTWDQINGVTVLYKSVVQEIGNIDRDFKIIILYPSREEKITRMNDQVIIYAHRPKFCVSLPGYSEIIQGFPDKDIFERVEEKINLKIDVVHICSPGIFASRLAGIAAKRGYYIIGFYHTFIADFVEFYLPDFGPLKKFYQTFGEWLDKLAYRYCRKIIYYTERSANHIGQYITSEIEYLSEVLDSELYSSGTKETEAQFQKRKNKDEKLQIGFIGRVAKEKSIESLIQFHRVLKEKKIQVHIIGHGPLINRFRSLENIIIRGVLKGNELVRAYRSLDFNIITARNDTLNMTLLEAAACGIPSVARKNTVPADLIMEYGCGMIIEDFNDPKWIDELKKLYHSDQYIEMKKNCIQFAEKKSLKIGLRKLLSLWKEATV